MQVYIESIVKTFSSLCSLPPLQRNELIVVLKMVSVRSRRKHILIEPLSSFCVSLCMPGETWNFFNEVCLQLTESIRFLYLP